MGYQLTASQLQTIFQIQRNLELVRYEAVMGDGAGRVLDPASNGFNVFVRYQTSNNLGWPQSVRKPKYNNVSFATETPVWVGFNEDGELAVIGPRILAQIQSGSNGLNNVVQANPVTTFSMSNAVDLRSQPTAPVSMNITVKSLWYVHSGVAQFFPGEGAFDITSYVPATASTQSLCLVYLDKSDNTIHAVASTPISSAGGMAAFGVEDVQECVAATSPSISEYSSFWQLVNGMTVVDDSRKNMDFRQWLGKDIGAGSSGGDILIPIKRSWFGA